MALFDRRQLKKNEACASLFSVILFETAMNRIYTLAKPSTRNVGHSTKGELNIILRGGFLRKRHPEAALCSGLMKPDTPLGENDRRRGV